MRFVKGHRQRSALANGSGLADAGVADDADVEIREERAGGCDPDLLFKGGCDG